MNPINYEALTMVVLKATAVNQSTITAGDLAWAINYQRVTRSINDVLLRLKPVCEDNHWPPLTSLVIVKSTGQPSVTQALGTDWRIAQRQCWAWGREQSDHRQRIRGQQSWADYIAAGGT